jgi:hypothetical protein
VFQTFLDVGQAVVDIHELGHEEAAILSVVGFAY